VASSETANAESEEGGLTRGLTNVPGLELGLGAERTRKRPFRGWKGCQDTRIWRDSGFYGGFMRSGGKYTGKGIRGWFLGDFGDIMGIFI
jgi:hypothetical protein